MNAFYWLLTLMLLGFGSAGPEAEKRQVANLDAPVIERQEVSGVETEVEVKRSTGVMLKGRRPNHNETLLRDSAA